jgi:hypothetical protein
MTPGNPDDTRPKTTIASIQAEIDARMFEQAPKHVPHGWRSTFSTIMNEKAEREGRASDRAVIDLMLPHVPENDVERACNRAAFMPSKREIAQAWANTLLEGAIDTSSLVIGMRR